MLTPVCLGPLRYSQSPGSPPSLSQGTRAFCERPQNLFQLAAADFKTGNHHLSLLRRLAVPGVVNPVQRATGNVPRACHQGCESPLETTLKQPFACL